MIPLLKIGSKLNRMLCQHYLYVTTCHLINLKKYMFLKRLKNYFKKKNCKQPPPAIWGVVGPPKETKNHASTPWTIESALAYLLDFAFGFRKLFCSRKVMMES